jgi:hypothetical protein
LPIPSVLSAGSPGCFKPGFQSTKNAVREVESWIGATMIKYLAKYQD